MMHGPQNAKYIMMHGPPNAKYIMMHGPQNAKYIMMHSPQNAKPENVSNVPYLPRHFVFIAFNFYVRG